jgi:hypothetical protein
LFRLCNSKCKHDQPRSHWSSSAQTENRGFDRKGG